MDIALLRTVATVARLGSFAAAARANNVDPSSISRAVAQAEREIGARLFQRTTRRLSLTEAGERLLQRLEPMLGELDQALDEARGIRAAIAGTVRATASVAYGTTMLVPLLSHLKSDYPDMKVELLLSDDNLDLVRERIDFGIRLAPEVSGDMICSKLHPTRYFVCASPAYLADAPPLRKPSDLAKHECLLFALDEYRRRWLFRNANGRTTEVPVQGRIIISNALGLKAAALSHMGPALLADWLVRDALEAGRLISVFDHHHVTATTFDTAAWLVYPSRTYLPARTRVAMDFFRAQIGSSHGQTIR